MARKIVIVLLYLAGLLFILGGALFTLDSPLNEAPDLPVWHQVFGFFFGSGFIVLGILSLKRARCFRSAWLAFLLLPVRICTFILAIAHFFASIPSIEESMANSTSEIHSQEGIFFAVLAFIFLGVTILLTLANKDKSAKTTSLALAFKYISAKKTSLTSAGKYTSEGTEYLTPPGKDTSAGIDYLTQAGKAKFAKRLTNQQDGRYVIDPRDFRRDRFIIGFMIVFWLIWAPATAVFTYLAITDPKPFYFLWLVFGYLVTIIIPVSLLRMNKKQVLEVAGDSLVVDTLAIIPPFKVRIDKLDLQALTLERYRRVHRDMDETVFTLNLIRKGSLWPKRISLAHYVKLEDQAVIFEEIKEFLEQHGFAFVAINEWTGLSGLIKVPGRWEIRDRR